jgi:hypothetical protein
MAMTLTPVILIPFMLFSGFFVNLDNVPWFLKEFEYISLYKYGNQALILNEYTDIKL